MRSGYASFRRNGWLSTATILVMALVLFVLGGLVFFSALTNTVLASLEEKIDISVYFVADASEEDMLAVKKELEALPDTGNVVYVSRDKALEEFKSRHQANALIASALEEVGENPLLASLNVKAKN